MNTHTAVATYVFGCVVVLLIGLVIHRMLRGWKRRSERQAALIGVLPDLPDRFGPAVLAPTRGLYVGSTIAPDWLERITVGIWATAAGRCSLGTRKESCWNAPAPARCGYPRHR